MDPYDMLGLPRGADAAQVRKRYHALAKRWHPDRHRGLPTEAEAHGRMAEINRAYVQLRSGASERQQQTAEREEQETSKSWVADDEQMMREARSLAAQGRCEAAVAILRQCRLRSVEWYTLIGQCQMILGDTRGAEDSFRWAARRERRDTGRGRRFVPWWTRAVMWLRALLRAV